MDCGVFTVQAVCLKGAVRRWRRRSAASTIPYRQISSLDSYFSDSDGEWWPKKLVKVIVGKERRVFEVDAQVLEEDPFQILMGRNKREKESRDSNNPRRERKYGENGKIFVDCDAILFEHFLWLLDNDCTALWKMNLEEIIEFYTQDPS
ncbi:hypothetical protein AMTRI_Chr04g252510 [Amborella trichopoda]|uniref:Uncharacterized protein n=1 Tax=Amborella trichopoda TaxID=13333 RepID=W1NFW5_AMBTC|nr:uncharacterized protein LOC18422396 [Amborella trichopoda]ERM94368.1 hypothetical protein AMTR_s00010p00248950 [Amborella trichopoda]|eukprot:XP_006827131.1 uncharacterized protein LOC18422396 [Amborella trichopoda]